MYLPCLNNLPFSILQIDYGYAQYPFQSFPKPSNLPATTVVATPPPNNETIPASPATPSTRRVQRATPTYLSWDLDQVCPIIEY